MWEEMSYNKYKSSNRLKDEYEPDVDEDDINNQTAINLLNIELETEEEQKEESKWIVIKIYSQLMN